MAQESALPWYESNLFWGPLSLGFAIALTVSAAMKHDLRGLLILAWPLFVFASWTGIKVLASARLRKTLLTASIFGFGLAMFGMAWWLAPNGTQSTLVKTPESPITGQSPENPRVERPSNPVDPKAIKPGEHKKTKPSPDPVTQDCQQSNCIGGDNYGNQSYNNFAPPERHLTAGQSQALDAIAATLTTDYSSRLYVKTINTIEALKFANEINDRFAGKSKHIEIALSWNPPPDGMFVLVHDTDSPELPIAHKIADALSGTGHPAQYGPADWVKQGDICIVVGTPPSK